MGATRALREAVTDHKDKRAAGSALEDVENVVARIETACMGVS
jgi:hypothetical protein